MYAARTPSVTTSATLPITTTGYTTTVVPTITYEYSGNVRNTVSTGTYTPSVVCSQPRNFDREYRDAFQLKDGEWLVLGPDDFYQILHEAEMLEDILITRKKYEAETRAFKKAHGVWVEVEKKNGKWIEKGEDYEISDDTTEIDKFLSEYKVKE